VRSVSVSRSDVVRQGFFASLILGCVNVATKQLVSKVKQIRVDDVRLAIVGDLLNAPCCDVLGDFRTVDPCGLTGNAQHAAQGVEAHFTAAIK